MQAHTLVQVDALFHIIVASLASTLIAIWQTKCCSVVTSRNDSIIFCNNCTVAFFHAVASRGCQFCELHEVCIERWSHELFVVKLELSQFLIKLSYGRKSIIKASLDKLTVLCVHVVCLKIKIIKLNKII